MTIYTTSVARALVSQRGLRQSTADMYAGSLWRLYDGLSAYDNTSEEWQFMRDIEGVEAWLADPDNVSGRGSTTSGPSRQHVVSDAAKAQYYKALVAGCLTFLDAENDEAVIKAVAYWRTQLSSINATANEKTKRQQLDGMEIGRWAKPNDIMRNAAVLEERWRAQPGNYKNHLGYVLYQLYTQMKDTCVFRLDVVYTLHVGVQEEEDVNYITPDHIVMNNYKTSDRNGRVTIPLAPSLRDILRYSFNHFPRKYFITSVRSYQKPLKQPNAANFVKQCWILDDRAHKPTADDIRSSLATRFFHLNIGILPRDVFATFSMSSRPTMEAYYFKINEDR